MKQHLIFATASIVLLSLFVAVISQQFLSTPTIQWGRGLGSVSNDTIYSTTTAVWSSTNKEFLYICGQSDEPWESDGVSVQVTSGMTTPYLLKIRTASQQLAWSKVFPGNEKQFCEQVIVDDSTHDVYVLVSGGINWSIHKFNENGDTLPNYPIEIEAHQNAKIAVMGEKLFLAGHLKTIPAGTQCGGNAWLTSWMKDSANQAGYSCIFASQGVARVFSLVPNFSNNKLLVLGNFDGLQVRIGELTLPKTFDNGNLYLASFNPGDISQPVSVKSIAQSEPAIVLDAQTYDTSLFVSTWASGPSKNYIHFLDINGDILHDLIAYENLKLKSIGVVINDKLIMVGEQSKPGAPITLPTGDSFASPAVGNAFMTAVKVDASFMWVSTLTNTAGSVAQVSLVIDTNLFLLLGATLKLDEFGIGQEIGMIDIYAIAYNVVAPPPVASSPVPPIPSPRPSGVVPISSSPRPIIPPVTYVRNVSFTINTTTLSLDTPIVIQLNDTKLSIRLDANTTFSLPTGEVAQNSTDTSQAISIEVTSQNLNLEQFSGVSFPTSYNVYESNDMINKVGEVIGNGVSISSSTWNINNAEVCARVTRSQVASTYSVYSFASKSLTDSNFINQQSSLGQKVSLSGSQVCTRVSIVVSSSNGKLAFPALVRPVAGSTSVPISRAMSRGDNILLCFVIVFILTVVQVLF